MSGGDGLQRAHFQQGGDAYAAHRPAYPPELSKWLASLCFRKGQAVDVGCGTGQFSCLLPEYFEAVRATDVSASQIGNATACARVEYVVEPAERIGLGDGSVDLVVAAQAAHWFELPKFYEEVQRVARVGSVLALVSYGVPGLPGRVGEAFVEQYWGPLHELWPEGREHVEQGYAGLEFPFPEVEIPVMAIERDWDLVGFLGYFSTWSAVKKAWEAGRDDLVTGMRESLSQAWGDPAEVRRVTFPINGRVAVL